MVDPEIAMRLPRVKSPSQISKFCVIVLSQKVARFDFENQLFEKIQGLAREVLT